MESRINRLLSEEYKAKGGDIISEARAIFPEHEVQRVEKSLGTKSFSDVQELVEYVETQPGCAAVIVCALQSDRIFTNLMKKQAEKYPNTAEMHRRLLEKYPPVAAESKKKEDQGILDVGITGEVVTRFPPEPNGYLHIGHAKALFLNEYFSKKNGGRLIVRFDDTNPAKEKEEYESAILEDLALLGVTEYALSHTSDYFDEIIQLAEQLIGAGKAYCDDTEKEQMQKERDEGVESRRRNSTPEQNRAIFREMLEGQRREFCLRAKISMGDNNKAMRDPVIFRRNDETHYRVGRKYKIYPTYDFACPIVDTLEGVTHTLRANEYRDRNPQYFWFIENLKMHKSTPRIVDFSRLNFEDTVLSKRKLKHIVDTYGLSWDDPRMPTIRGIRRKGLRMDALREYILMQGVAQRFTTISWDKLWAINKKKIDADSPRYFAVRKDAVRVSVLNHVPGFATVPRSAKNEALGTRRLFCDSDVLIDREDALCLGEGDEIRLMHWCNAVVRKIEKESNLPTLVVVELNPGGDVKATKYRLNWVSLRGCISVSLVEYGNLTKGDSENLDEIFNRDSRTAEDYFAENAVSLVAEGEIVQFERLGFYYADANFEFNLVPFTKQLRKY